MLLAFYFSVDAAIGLVSLMEAKSVPENFIFEIGG
jgi:hypothetical protein